MTETSDLTAGCLRSMKRSSRSVEKTDKTNLDMDGTSESVNKKR